MEPQLQNFVRWLQANGVQLRNSGIKGSNGCNGGLGLFSLQNNTQGVIMVVPLHLAITPMRVLQDSELGEAYGKLFEDGDVDDRLLMILFLLVERLRGPTSFWRSYLEVLPSHFGTPLWFTEKELEELKGTALYNATIIQLKNLKALFTDKVKPFAEDLLKSIAVVERKIEFQDFLWANCIFWTRALTIPFPQDFVFPKHFSSVTSNDACPQRSENDLSTDSFPQCRNTYESIIADGDDNARNADGYAQGRSKFADNGDEILNNQSATAEEAQGETVWVEGLVPGIDFCNHDPKGVARWEVDGSKGLLTGVPNSMYLLTDAILSEDAEILISYGNKGNEELLFLYGFVLKNNADDYLMVHFPKEALDKDPCGAIKIELLNEQMLSLRWLLPSTLLKKGFYTQETDKIGEDCKQAVGSSYSWSGNRKPPTYLQHFVFPEDTIAALRVVAMKEDELQMVSSMLQELSKSGLQKAPSSEDIRAAIWEVCGNSGALQLLTDLLATRMLDLEEGTGSEESDNAILERDFKFHFQDASKSGENDNSTSDVCLSDNVRACVIYRQGQKSLARQFLKESEQLLELCMLEEQQ